MVLNPIINFVVYEFQKTFAIKEYLMKLFGCLTFYNNDVMKGLNTWVHYKRLLEFY